MGDIYIKVEGRQIVRVHHFRPIQDYCTAENCAFRYLDKHRPLNSPSDDPQWLI